MNIYNELPDDLQKKIDNILITDVNKDELNEAIKKMYNNDFYFASWYYGKIKNLIYDYYEYYIDTDMEAMYDDIPPMMISDKNKYLLSSFDFFIEDNIFKHKLTSYTILKNILDNDDNKNIIEMIKKVFDVDDVFINEAKKHLLHIENTILFFTTMDKKYVECDSNFDINEKTEVLIEKICIYVSDELLKMLKNDFENISKIYEKYSKILHLYGCENGNTIIPDIEKLINIYKQNKSKKTNQSKIICDDLNLYLEDIEEKSMTLDEKKYNDFIEENEYVISKGIKLDILKLFKENKTDELEKIQVHNFTVSDYLNEAIEMFFY